MAEINTSLRGLKELKAYLLSVPRGVKEKVLIAMSVYIIGNERRGLKHYPKRVQHGPNNPYIFETDKQRRAFFYYKGFGRGIPTPRTNKLKDSWDYSRKDNNWTQVKIFSTAPYASFVQGEDIQKGHAADGWRKVEEVVDDNLDGAFQAADRAVDKFLASK